MGRIRNDYMKREMGGEETILEGVERIEMVWTCNENGR
jgi:hypothetical protein